MRNLRSARFALVLVICTILSLAMVGLAQSEEIGQPSDVGLNSHNNLDKAKDFYAFSETPDGNGLLLTRKDTPFFYDNPKPFSLPVFVLNRAKSEKVRLEEIVVSDESARIRAKLNIGTELESAADIAKSRDDVLAALVDHDSETAKKIHEKAYFKPDVSVSLEDLSLKDGDHIRLFVQATFKVGKKATTTTTEAIVSIASLPSRASWYCGDGHIHTDWSDGYWTIYHRANWAKNNGYKWMIVTDHEDLITANGGWQSYVSACNSNQSSTGIVVAPGAEITSASPYGDALGYGLKESATSIPKNKTLSAQSLINSINSHNSPTSFANIAHPYGNPAWPDWNVTGFKAMEIMSNSFTANSSAINKWYEKLQSGLQNTIAGGGFIVGLGGSDVHGSFEGIGLGGSTWIYAPDYSSTNRSAVYNALKAGKASASGDGNLGAITLNGYLQGSVVNLSAGSSCTLRVVYQPRSDRRCTRAEIRNLNNNVVWSKDYPSGTETSIPWIAPSQDWFYIARFTFDNGWGGNVTEVWTNPVFVNIP